MHICHPYKTSFCAGDKLAINSNTFAESLAFAKTSFIIVVKSPKIWEAIKEEATITNIEEIK